MPTRRGVMDAGALPRLVPQFYPSTIAIQAATVTQDEAGQPVYVWADVAGLEAVRCVIAPINSAVNPEVRRADGTIVTDAWQVSLAGHYPQITTDMRIYADDGRGWDVLGVEHDSHGQMTRLKAELVH